jgi:hypothetical protein
MTPAEYSRWLAATIAHTRTIGGGRLSCCARERCALHLAEEHPAGMKASTVHLGSSLAVFPDTPSQELAGSGAREAYRLGLEALGIVR